MSVFSIGIMLISQTFIFYIKMSKAIEIETQFKIDSTILGIIAQYFNWK